jgi:hypothetical protein
VIGIPEQEARCDPCKEEVQKRIFGDAEEVCRFNTKDSFHGKPESTKLSSA